MPERSAPHDAGPHDDDVATGAGIRRPADVAGSMVEVTAARAFDTTASSPASFASSRATAWPGAGARVDDVVASSRRRSLWDRSARQPVHTTA